MHTPRLFARFCAYMEYDPDESAKALLELHPELTEDQAREAVQVAIRERQELDITDTHTEVLDQRAREGENRA